MAYDSSKYGGHNSTMYYTGKDGKTYTLKLGNKDGYGSDNWLREGTGQQLEAIVQYYIEHGKVPTRSEIRAYSGLDIGPADYSRLTTDLDTFITKNNIDIGTYGSIASGEEVETNPQESAYNSYYRDLYSLEDGTLGADMLDRYTVAEQNAAVSNMQLAEAQYQQAAMQQAEVVKSITDQVKAERMARLRAGMSESQIANQDMQMMINNMNTLNQQTVTMNQNRLAAQQQYNLAQDTAYQQYINSATGLGSVNAAMAASDAGDAYMQALKYQRQNGGTFSNAYNRVTTGGGK